MNENIEARIRSGPQTAIVLPSFGELELEPVQLFHRTDYHEDGSHSEWYGIELTKEQFDQIKRRGWQGQEE